LCRNSRPERAEAKKREREEAKKGEMGEQQVHHRVPPRGLQDCLVFLSPGAYLAKDELEQLKRFETVYKRKEFRKNMEQVLRGGSRGRGAVVGFLMKRRYGPTRSDLNLREEELEPVQELRDDGSVGW
jgi:hypothetical protein